MRHLSSRLLLPLILVLATTARSAELSSKDLPATPDRSPAAWPATTSSSAPNAPVVLTELKDAPKAETPAPAPATTPSDVPQTKPAKPESARTEGSSRLLEPDTELIDMPTAAVVDYGSYSTRTRFFSNGGVVEWLSFGVFQRLNLGASLNIDKLLGTQTPVQITRPDLQVKFRFYDGTTIIPAFAAGFDGQGYMYNRVSHRYDQRQRGLYFVGSQEIGIPGLQGHAGINVPDFDDNPVAGFMGVNYNIQDTVGLMAEWDNIADFPESRLNIGFRVYITPNFSLDFAARTIGQGGRYTNGVERGSERVVMFKYTGSF